jgi:diguanylate cyclase (GGDEF)-like protein/PAS domain S-box-containing protein
MAVWPCGSTVRHNPVFADKRPMWRRSPALGWRWTALLALGVAATVAYSVVPRSPASELGLFDGIVALAVIASVFGWRRARANERVAWLCSSLALAGFLAGQLIWWQYPATGLGPFQSAADAFFLLSCLPFAIAAASLASAREPDRDRSAWLDAGILTAVAGVVSWYVLMEPHVRNPALGSVSKLVAIAHPLADVLVLGFVLRLVLSRNARDRSAMSFATGVSLILVTNLVFYGQNLPESFRPGSAADAAWLLGYLLIGFAALHPSTEQAVRSNDREAGRGRLGLVLSAVVIPVVVLALELGRRDLVGLNTLTIAVCVSMLVITLAAVRSLRFLGRARQAEVHRGEARLSALILHSADAIFLVDRDCRIAFASPSAADLWGRRAKALLGASILDSFVEEHREAVARQLDNLVAMAAGATVPLEGRVRAEGGQVRELEGIARNLLEDENVRAIVVTMRDTTSRRELEQQLERRAFQDELTGLANRALFADRLDHALNRTARDSDVRIAVLFVDLDDFKAVNDGMGHGAGDEVIRGVAERIRTCVRPGDTVARLGGDEFAVLLEDIPSTSHVSSLAQRLLEVLQLPIDVTGVSLAVPASVGVTFATRDSTVESLLRDADIAMYSAKSQGKSRVAMFDATLGDVAVQRLALKVELPEALRSDQFRLVYQPIKDVRSGDLRGFEALIRWHHPQRGLVSPGEFIPAAEETGMIVDIGRWVLEQACDQAVFWNRRSPDPLSISVNVSGLQLRQTGFTDELRRILETTGLAASLLTLELTESILVEHQRVESILGELRAIGVGIAIDDFGTGYSSLSYLQQFPATSINVDRSFVAALADRGEVGLVRSILSIGDALGLTTVAEGVETVEQLEALRALGCDRAQGFLLGRPQAAGEIDDMLEVIRMARTAEWRSAAAVSASDSG